MCNKTAAMCTHKKEAFGVPKASLISILESNYFLSRNSLTCSLGRIASSKL